MLRFQECIIGLHLGASDQNLEGSHASDGNDDELMIIQRDPTIRKRGNTTDVVSAPAWNHKITK